MTELRIDKPTLIAKVEGTVFVMDADGSLRVPLACNWSPGCACSPNPTDRWSWRRLAANAPLPTQPEAALPAGADAEAGEPPGGDPPGGRPDQIV